MQLAELRTNMSTFHSQMPGRNTKRAVVARSEAIRKCIKTKTAVAAAEDASKNADEAAESENVVQAPKKKPRGRPPRKAASKETAAGSKTPMGRPKKGAVVTPDKRQKGEDPYGKMYAIGYRGLGRVSKFANAAAAEAVMKSYSAKVVDTMGAEFRIFEGRRAFDEYESLVKAEGEGFDIEHPVGVDGGSEATSDEEVLSVKKKRKVKIMSVPSKASQSQGSKSNDGGTSSEDEDATEKSGNKRKKVVDDIVDSSTGSFSSGNESAEPALAKVKPRRTYKFESSSDDSSLPTRTSKPKTRKKDMAKTKSPGTLSLDNTAPSGSGQSDSDAVLEKKEKPSRGRELFRKRTKGLSPIRKEGSQSSKSESSSSPDVRKERKTKARSAKKRKVRPEGRTKKEKSKQRLKKGDSSSDVSEYTVSSDSDSRSSKDVRNHKNHKKRPKKTASKVSESKRASSKRKHRSPSEGKGKKRSKGGADSDSSDPVIQSDASAASSEKYCRKEQGKATLEYMKNTRAAVSPMKRVSTKKEASSPLAAAMSKSSQPLEIQVMVFKALPDGAVAQPVCFQVLDGGTQSPCWCHRPPAWWGTFQADITLKPANNFLEDIWHSAGWGKRKDMTKRTSDDPISYTVKSGTYTWQYNYVFLDPNLTREEVKKKMQKRLTKLFNCPDAQAAYKLDLEGRQPSGRSKSKYADVLALPVDGDCGSYWSGLNAALKNIKMQTYCSLNEVMLESTIAHVMPKLYPDIAEADVQGRHIDDELKMYAFGGDTDMKVPEA